MKKGKIKEIIYRVYNRLSKTVIWIISAIVFLVITQVAFRISAPTIWLEAVWEADGFITFTGTIVLGIVAIYQNIKSNKLAQDMKKLEEARFVSMISLKKFFTNYANEKCSTSSYTEYKDAEIIKLMKINGSTTMLCAFAEFNNSSDFPIVGFSAHIKGEDNLILKRRYGLETVENSLIYIPEKESVKIRFEMNFNKYMEMLNMMGKDKPAIVMCFENIFGYKLKAFLYMTVDKKTITCTYRLAKFTDVKSNEESS